MKRYEKEVEAVYGTLRRVPRYCLMLLGPPGAGKTTFRHELMLRICQASPPLRLPEVVSLDDYVHGYAEYNDMTYDAAYYKCRDEAVQDSKNSFKSAVLADLDIIIDQTNLTTSTRRKFLTNLPEHYSTFFVSFHVEPEIARQRIATRGLNGAPYDAYERLAPTYETPEPEEFGLGWFINESITN